MIIKKNAALNGGVFYKKKGKKKKERNDVKMVAFIEWVFELLGGIVGPIVSGFMTLIGGAVGTTELLETTFNLYLFSDNLILSITIYDIILLIVSLIVCFVAVRLIWKVLRKVFRKLFFWGKW